MGAFFGNGVSYTHDYQGEIAFVEVILVKQSQSKRFPFEITPLLTESDETYDYEPAVLTTFSRKQYDSQFGRMKSEPIPAGDGWMGDPAATFNDGPLALALFQPQANSFFGASGNIKLQLPLVPGLSDNLSAAELMIDLVKTEAGHNHTADFNGYITLSRPVQYYMNGRPVYEEGKGYLEGNENFTIRYSDDESAISSIEGKLRLRLPTALENLDFGGLELGKQVGNDVIGIKLSAIRSGALVFRISGQRDKLVNFHVLDRNGRHIGPSQLTLDQDDDGWYATVGFSGTPERVELVYANGQDMVSYPFELNIAAQ